LEVLRDFANRRFADPVSDVVDPAASESSVQQLNPGRRA
jgi:hypothetical protein